MALPYNPLEKPQKRTPEEKRRRKAEVWAIKAEFHPELYAAPMKADPSEHDRYRVTGSALHTVSKRRLKEHKGKVVFSTFGFKVGAQRLTQAKEFRRSTKPWRNLSARHDWAKTPKARARLKQVGERAKRLAAPLAEWRRKVWAVWGSCIITGENRRGWAECHHMYDRAIRPQWVTEVWNGIPLETRTIHPLADTYPGFHKALIAVADECRAAADGRRPSVSRAEAREVIFRLAPKVRKYANPEEE